MHVPLQHQDAWAKQFQAWKRRPATPVLTHGALLVVVAGLATGSFAQSVTADVG